MGIVIRNTNQGGRITFRGLGLGGRITSGWPVASTSALLLDTYPGAAAAYSLRKLRTAYNGSAIRVRRSSDNTEQDIGFVNNELDTASLLTFCGVGNGFITTWYDQSGNIKNATQATAGAQPQIINGGVIYTKNTKPSILNSFTTFLALPSTITGTSGTLINLSATLADPPTGDNGSPFGFCTTSNDSSYQPFSNGIIYENFASTTRQTVGNPTNNTTNLYLYNVISDINLYNVKINNLTFFNTTTNSVGYGIQSPRIGRSFSSTFGNQGFVGYITEIVVYTNNQNSNISGINTNINSYYTIY